MPLRLALDIAGMLIGCFIAIKLDAVFDSAAPAAAFGYIWGATMPYRYEWINAS